MLIRGAKIGLTACVGALALLVGLDNVLDYQTNFEVVRHIMSMDTIPPGSPLAWRAINSELLYRLTYWLIIAAELAAGVIILWGCVLLTRVISASAACFNGAKSVAIAGLSIGLALYLFGFMLVGGEWFQMWRSNGWNMQEPAFRFIGSVGLILVFLAQSEDAR